MFAECVSAVMAHSFPPAVTAGVSAVANCILRSEKSIQENGHSAAEDKMHSPPGGPHPQDAAVAKNLLLGALVANKMARKQNPCQRAPLSFV
jgi:hypothetical protein